MIARRWRSRGGTTLLAAVGVLSTVVLAAPGRTAEEQLSGEAVTYSFPAVADAYVMEAKPKRNFGTATTLVVEPSPVVSSYLRFDVQGLNGTVARATLWLLAKSNSSVGYDVRGVSVNTWDERKITYSNAPPPAPSVTGSSGSFATDAWTTVDVTPLVTGAGAVSIALTGASALSLASRESGSAATPALVVEVVPTPPENVVPPSVTGFAVQGETLGSDPGVWTGTLPLTYEHQWLRCDAGAPVADCSPVGEATASTYVLGAEDVGHTLRVAVTASNAGGSAAASSVESPIVVVPSAPESTELPTIAGVPEEGWRLQASSGTWSGTQPIAYAYQWLRCSEAGGDCAAILDAGDQSYRAAADDVGHTLRVAVTASNSAGSSVATSLPTEPVAPAPAPEGGIWISAGELAGLPMTGPAWDQLKATADGGLGTAKIADQNSNHDVRTLAVALVYGRTGTAEYRAKAADAIMSAIETENGGGSLALARNLASYILAADLIDLRGYDAAKEERFRTWLNGVRVELMSDGRTLISTHEDRPNNFGTMAGASRAAAAVYLGDTADLARTAQVFLGWLGDRSSYAGFRYGSDLSWQADPTQPVGVNPLGAVKEGHTIDGALPEEMRRGCSFRFPPCATGYPWGALQGATVQAEVLFRQGYLSWDWQNLALLRAVQFLYDLNAQYPNDGWWAWGDDTFIPWLTNVAYRTGFPTVSPIAMGKNMGFTDWTHGSASSGSASASPPAPRQTAGAVDTGPPTLVDLRVLTASVDANGGPAIVEVQAEIVDDVSGVREGETLIELQSPSGAQRAEARLSPVGGDDFWASVTIPVGAEPGIWTVSRLVVQDEAGNRDALGAIDLAYENGLYPTVAVNVPPDRRPPLLDVPTDVALAATSSRGARFTFAASARDDLDRVPELFCTYPSYGWVFPAGKTTVICVARDASGNEARRTFTVVVTQP